MAFHSSWLDFSICVSCSIFCLALLQCLPLFKSLPTLRPWRQTAPSMRIGNSQVAPGDAQVAFGDCVHQLSVFVTSPGSSFSSSDGNRSSSSLVLRQIKRGVLKNRARRFFHPCKSQFRFDSVCKRRQVLQLYRSIAAFFSKGCFFVQFILFGRRTNGSTKLPCLFI